MADVSVRWTMEESPLFPLTDRTALEVSVAALEEAAGAAPSLLLC